MNAEQVNTTTQTEIRRILLLLEPGGVHPLALDCALRLARRHRVELVGLLREDAALLQAASLPFGSEISLQGGEERRFDRVSLERQLANLEQRLRETVAKAARDVAFSSRRLPAADLPALLLESQCSDLLVLGRPRLGPWSIAAHPGLVTVLGAAAGGDSQLADVLDALNDEGAAQRAGRTYRELVHERLGPAAPEALLARLRARRPSLLLAPHPRSAAAPEADLLSLLRQVIEQVECPVILY